MAVSNSTKLDPAWEPTSAKSYQQAMKYGVSHADFQQQFRQFAFFYGMPGEELASWEHAWQYWFSAYCISLEATKN